MPMCPLTQKRCWGSYCALWHNGRCALLSLAESLAYRVEQVERGMG